MVAVTTVVAVIFGFSVAFLGVTAESRPVLLWIGAVLVGLLFIVLLLIPFLRGAVSGQAGRPRD